MLRYRLAALVLSSWSAVRAGDAGTVSNDLSQSLSVGAKPSLSVEIDAGSVTIARGAAGRVDVAATRLASGQTALNALTLDIGRDGDRVRVVFRRGADALANQSVILHLMVPETTSISVSTGSGSITVGDTGDGARLKTGAGTVITRNVRGPLDIVAGSGGIEVWGADGSVRAEASAGSVKVEGDYRAASRVSSSAGAVTVRLYPDAGPASQCPRPLHQRRVRAEGSDLGHEASGQVGDGSKGTVEAIATAGRVELLKR